MNTKKLLAVLLLNSVVFGGGAVYFYSQYKKNIYYSNSVLILPNGSQTMIVPSTQFDAGAKFKSKSTPAVRQDVSYAPTVSAPLSDVSPKAISTGTASNTLSSTYAYNGSSMHTISRSTSSAAGSGGGSSVAMPLTAAGKPSASTQLTESSGSGTLSKTVLSNTSAPVNAPTATDGTTGDIIPDPGGDPTTPPIPVGDGIMIMLILSIAYAGGWKRVRRE